MAGLHDLSRGELQDILKRLRQLESAAPLQNASIGAGGLRVYDGGVITIQNGGLSVTGTATITGTLQADGTITFTGTFNQSGPTTFTGDTKLNGPTHINGTTDIAGNVTTTGTFTQNGTTNLNGTTSVKGDMNVTGGGKIKIGSSMTLDPSVSSGALVFSNGAQVFTDATTVQMFKGTSAVTVADGTATVQGNGSNYVRSDTTGNTIAGPLKNTSHSTVSSVTANVYMDASGNIKRIV